MNLNHIVIGINEFNHSEEEVMDIPGMIDSHKDLENIMKRIDQYYLLPDRKAK